MFETHFGLAAPPFQLSPDPGFYFPSAGHVNAFDYLKYGLYQREGFIVVTGEVGAGKTLLVNKLLAEVDASRIVAAHIVNTQFDARELLEAIGLAFGAPAPAGTSKAHVIAALEAFLRGVAASGRRALLVVDEAQNLDMRVIEELRMLSNLVRDGSALLQSFLVGQPELRRLMGSPTLAQFRQRVIASCHLSPLDAAETRQYVEHRLLHAGWDRRPIFDEQAWPALHAGTDGVPRRINLLCSRAMLAACLGARSVVDAAEVGRSADALAEELGPAPGAA